MVKEATTTTKWAIIITAATCITGPTRSPPQLTTIRPLRAISSTEPILCSHQEQLTNSEASMLMLLEVERILGTLTKSKRD